MDRKCKDILQQALSPDYKSIRRAHLEKRHFGVVDIQGFMAAIYADNLPHRSITSAGIAGPGATIKPMGRDLSNAQCHSCLMFGH